MKWEQREVDISEKHFIRPLYPRTSHSEQTFPSFQLIILALPSSLCVKYTSWAKCVLNGNLLLFKSWVKRCLAKMVPNSISIFSCLPSVQQLNSCFSAPLKSETAFGEFCPVHISWTLLGPSGKTTAFLIQEVGKPFLSISLPLLETWSLGL